MTMGIWAVAAFEAAAHLEAVHRGQVNIQHHQLGQHGADEAQALGAVVGDGDFNVAFGEVSGNLHGLGVAVLDEDDGWMIVHGLFILPE